MATRPRPLCADVSRDNAEPLAATASRIDHWLLVEYRGRWGRQPLAADGLGDAVKAHLRAQLGLLDRSRLLFVKRPERRGREPIRVYHGTTLDRGGRFYRRDLDSYDELLEVELPTTAGEPLDHPLYVVCTHGKRDRCCAVYGQPLYEAAREELPTEWVWQSTHVGGDRFAGNLVVFPDGLYFGRVAAAAVSPLVAATRAGRIPLETYRGRCCYSFAEQAVERVLREQHRLSGVHDLTLAGVQRRGDGWRVAFRTREGELHEKLVVGEHGEPAYLTCDAAEPRRPRRFRIVD